jgi:hypothetical protein
MKFSIDTSNKPKLEALMKSDKGKAKEVIDTFVSLIEESLDDSNGIPWVDLPAKFGGGLTFPQLIKGILHGSLDLKTMNPAVYDIMFEEVHPLSMLTSRKDALSGNVKYSDWRKHFQLPQGTPINQDTIEEIFRKLLRYYKYVDVDDLAGAIMVNQIATFKGMGEANVQNLPFVPALRYQQRFFGDLYVGKFYDQIGAFDCGPISDTSTCPACKVEELGDIGKYKVCPSCNAGFEKAE